MGKGFLDRSIPYAFSRVFVLYTQRLQSRKELVCVQRASYSCCEIGLRGFPAAFLPMAEVVDEAQQGAVSVIFLLLLPLCPVFSCVHGSRVFQEYTQFLLSKARPSGLRAMKVSMSASSQSMAQAMWYSSMSFRSLALFLPDPDGRISCKPMCYRILYKPHSA